MIMSAFIPVTIKTMLDCHEAKLSISYSLAQFWGLNISQPILLKFGQKEIHVHIDCASNTKDEVFISGAIRDELLFPLLNIKLIAFYSSHYHSLTLGPLLGVLTDFIENDTDSLPYFRSIHSFCLEMQQIISENGGFLYILHPKDVEEGMTKGYYYQNEQWIKAEVPLPNVIYNRIHSRRIEKTKSFTHLRKIISSHNIPLFNERFLSKADVHQLLHLEEHILPYLPDTAIANHSNIANLCMKYSTLFIKPTHGSQGRQIIQIKKTAIGYEAAYSSGLDSENKRLYESIEDFLISFNKHMPERQYIVQQGISLLSYHNRPLDFRILCHKNSQNLWNVTSTVARISNEKQFVSNLAQGGEVMKPISLLTQLFDRNTAIQQLALMKELATEVCTIIDQKTYGLFGELGIDLGVDESGGLWIIEANSKPSKKTENHFNKVRPSAKALVEYCTSLAFSKIKNKEDPEHDIFRNYDIK